MSLGTTKGRANVPVFNKRVGKNARLAKMYRFIATSLINSIIQGHEWYVLAFWLHLNKSDSANCLFVCLFV